MTRTRRSILAFLSAFGFSAMSAILAMTATPLIVDWLGDAQFGAYRASLDWFGYAGLLELGIGGAITPLFVRAIASNDRNQIVSVARAGMRAYRPVSLLMALTCLFLTGILPWVLDLPTVSHREVWLGGGMFAIAALLTPLLTFRPYLEAAQSGIWINCLLFGQTIFTTTLALLAASMGTGLGGQLIAFSVGTSFLPLSLAWIGYRAYPELLRRYTETIPIGELWSLSWPTFIFNLCSRMAFLTDNLVIAAILGPSAVAPFFLTQRVIGLAAAQTQGIASSTWAGLIDIYMRGDLPGFHRRLLQTLRITTLVGIALLSPVAVWNSILIECWVGSERFAGSGVTWLATINAILLGIFSVLGWPLQLIGKIREVLPWGISISLANFLLTVALTYAVGTTGPLWGTFFAFVFVNTPGTLILIRRHFHLSPWRIIAAVARPALVGLLYTAGLALLQQFLPLGGAETTRWLKFAFAVLWVGLSSVAFLPLAWYFGLPKEDRQEAHERFMNWRNGNRQSS